MSVDFTKSKPKSLTTNAFWNGGLSIWQILVALVLTPFLIARIGTDYYGLFVLLMSISGFMGIMNLGLGDATLRFVAYYYDKNDIAGINRTVGATFFVYLFAGLVAWAILFFSADMIVGWLFIDHNDTNLAVALLELTAVSVGIGFVGSAFNSIPQALQRYDINARVQFALSLFHVSGTVAILTFWPGIYELVLWSVVTAVFTQVVNIAVARKLIPGIRIMPSSDRKGLKEVFGYGVFSFLTHVLGLLWANLDKLILGSFVGPASVAYFSPPQQLSIRGALMVSTLGGALFPRFSSISDDDERGKLFLDSTWVLLCMTIVIFVPLTALFPDFLRLWINPEFAEKSGWLAQVIAFSCIVRGAFVPYDALFRGIGKPQYLTVVFFATGMTSVIANLLLIPSYGLSGAGYAYLATTFWGFVAILFAWGKVLDAKSIYPLLRVVLLPIVFGYLALAIIVYIRIIWSVDLDWVSLASFGLLGAVLTGILLIAVEYFFGKQTSRTTILSKSVSRFIHVIIPAIK